MSLLTNIILAIKYQTETLYLYIMKKNMLLGVPLAVAALTNCTTEETKTPNILVILADDMGYGDVSCLDAQSKIKTPNLDKLASEGVVFTDAHSSSSVSTPTRYALLTGRYNWRSTMKTDVLSGFSKALIKPERSTIATMLGKQGYTTAVIGKWHLGWDWARRHELAEGTNLENLGFVDESVDYSKSVANGPNTRGFDYSYAFCGSLDMTPYVYVENDKPTAVPNRNTVNKGKYSWWRNGPTAPDFVHEDVLPNLINRACNYIKEKAKGEQPYFLYLPLSAPHTPILPLAEYRGKSGLGEYGDFVVMVDDMVGKVLAAIEQSGERDNTIVVFTTDNGCSPASGIPEMKALGHHPNSIYRGHKSDLFEGGHRIPCILRWPARVEPHQVNQTICHTDLYATFAAIAGYQMQDTEGEDSYNILPALLSADEVAPIREATVHHSINGQFTIRQGEWKLLLSPSSGGWSFPRHNDKKALEGLPPVQLYNMKDDPSEQKNLQAQYPEIVESLTKLMRQYVAEGRSTPGAPQKNDGAYPWKQLTFM